MPSASASRGASMRTGCPVTRISPAPLRYAPLSPFINVDLPAPFPQRRICMAPRSSVRSTPSRATTAGKVFRITRISRTGCATSGLYRVIYYGRATEQERKDRKERKETNGNQAFAAFAVFAFSTAGGTDSSGTRQQGEGALDANLA